MPSQPRRTGRPQQVARSGVLWVACLLCAGCATAGVEGSGVEASGVAGSGAGGAAAGSPRATVDLTAEMVQYRRDAQRDVIQVKVTNHGSDAVQVQRVEVRSPTFASPASAAKDSTIGAGLSVDLAVPLADPRCDGSDDGADDAVDDGADEAATGGHLAVLVADGTTVELPVDDVVLQEVRAQRCAEAAVGELVAATWQPGWEDAGVGGGAPALRGRLVLTPTSSTPVAVTVQGATTLFRVDEQVAADLRGEVAVLDVVVSVTRCDPHAVAEDKKGYLFPVRVRPDGGEEVLVEVPVPVPERQALQDLIERTCY